MPYCSLRSGTSSLARRYRWSGFLGTAMSCQPGVVGDPESHSDPGLRLHQPSSESRITALSRAVGRSPARAPRSCRSPKRASDTSSLVNGSVQMGGVRSATLACLGADCSVRFPGFFDVAPLIRCPSAFSVTAGRYTVTGRWSPLNRRNDNSLTPMRRIAIEIAAANPASVGAPIATAPGGRGSMPPRSR
jgi:hypothetical protein